MAGKDSRMKYFGGCDAGSTYTKCVIIDENGKILAAVTKRSRINPVLSAKDALDEAVSQVDGLNSAEELTYLIGTGYGRNKVPFADENISEISCHAMGVHVTDPSVKAIIDIGGQDVKGIAIDTDGTVLNFAMNDKCAAGTGRFFESMARAFEMSLDEFSNLSLTAKNVIPITAQCAVFAASAVIGITFFAVRDRLENSSKDISNALAIDSKNLPVPAAHLSFIAKLSTVPSVSIAIPLTS